MSAPSGYDPFRTPPLWIEPKAPLDYVHDENTSSDHDERHSRHDDCLDDWPKCPVREPAPKLAKFSSHPGTSMRLLLDFLIPPVTASQEAIRRWRLSISLTVLALSSSVPMMFGIAPFIPFSGFAYASDVTDIKVQLLERELFDSMLRQCSAKNEESREFYARKVQDLLTQYRKTAKASYQRPSCREITGSAAVIPPIQTEPR